MLYNPCYFHLVYLRMVMSYNTAQFPVSAIATRSATFHSIVNLQDVLISTTRFGCFCAERNAENLLRS